ncbi:MAG: cysteine desulfurase [Elusimicrobia bacterium]|nr:cysteine desulfurase [Elusimicrobiota bacterium]
MFSNRKPIYLDCNATTPVRPEVQRAMEPYWENVFGNPSSAHRYGQEAKAALELSRQKVARSLGAKNPDEIVFTSGGTEANVLGIRGTLGTHDRGYFSVIASGAAGATKQSQKGDSFNEIATTSTELRSRNDKRGHILASPIEHDSIVALLEQLSGEGYEVEYLGVDQDGRVDPEEVKAKVRADTVLTAVMYANNETGVIEPIAEIGRFLRERGILFHVDAVQAAGKIPFSVQDLGATTVAISGHKIGGPKGIGALWIDKATTLSPHHPLASSPPRPLFPGHQEGGLRAGTQNVAFAVGLGAALELAVKELPGFMSHLASLRRSFEEKIAGLIEDARFNGHREFRVANTTHVSFAGLEGKNLMIALDLEGVLVSTGSACASGVTKASRVLAAMGLEDKWSRGSLRFSFGRDTSLEDLDQTAQILAKAVRSQRKLSVLPSD